MRKEIIFAIIIGLLLGLLITFGIYIANKALKQKSQNQNITTIAPTPNSSPLTPEIDLKINEPGNNQVFDKGEITISGKTNKEAIITVLDESNQYFVESDKDGFFSQKINLIKGVNSLKVVATDLLGNQAAKELTIVYTTKLIEEKAKKNE